jgi:hypothetical protein
MIGQTSGNHLRRRRASRLAGALGLLLAVALIGGGILPAYVGAQGIPSQPMGFAGTVSTVTPAGPVPAGTLVQAFVGTDLRAETTTKAEGRYDNVLVLGPGGTVTFRVAGVLAQESIAWQSGELMSFDLTIPALSGVAFNLTMAVAPAGTGTATDVTNASPYAEGVAVSIKAVAATGYHFTHWTASTGSFANANAAETTFTMPAQDVTVTANFEVGAEYTLTMAASPFMGGTATDVTGASPYYEGEVVSIQAAAAAEYQFVRWQTTAGAFSNANAASTSFQMPGADVTVTAVFEVTGGGCFIATAAYGSPTAGQIDVLREFRDAVLTESTTGSKLVALYYKLSPPVADFISGNSFVRTLVRELLVDPVVWMVEATGGIWRR